MSFLLGFSLPAFAIGVDESLTPNDFAYGYDVITHGDNTVQSIELPISIYENSRSDLADIRLFNAEGDVIPFQLNSEKYYKVEEDQQEKQLPVFPIFGNSPTEKNRHIVLQNGVIIATDSAEDNKEKLTAYLLDNSKSPEGFYLVELEVFFNNQNSFLNEFAVEVSNDFTNWTVINSTAVVSRLHHLNETIELNRIKIPATQAKYLRFTSLSASSSDFLDIDSVYGTFSKKVTTVKANKYAVTDMNINKSKQAIYFSSPRNLPIYGIEIAFKSGNHFLKGELHQQNDLEKWINITPISQYQLSQENQQILSSPDMFYSATVGNQPEKEDQWKIQVNTSYLAAMDQIQSITLHWKPNSLAFLKLGKEPYTLAFGNPQIITAEQADNNLFQSDSVVAGKLSESMKTLGGSEKLVPPFSWQPLILFGILGFGVLILGFMAYRLVKDMKKSSD